MDDVKGKKKSIFKRWWFWVIAALIFIIAVSNGNKNTANTPSPNAQTNQTTANNTTGTTAINTTGTQNTTPNETTIKENVSFKEGMYKIGVDLTAGEYILISDGFLPAYYQVSKDSTGSLESIISNDNFTGNRYVTIADGQYLEIRGSKGYALDKAPSLKPANGKYTDGMYKVGKDIQAGEYKAIPEGTTGSSYVEITKDSKGTLNSIVSNDNFQAEKYFTIADGQYIKLVGCYIMSK